MKQQNAVPDYILAAKEKNGKFVRYAFLLIYTIAILYFAIGLTTAIRLPIAFTQFSDFYVGLLFCGFYVLMGALVQKKQSMAALITAIVMYALDSVLYLAGEYAAGVSSPVWFIGAAVMRVAILGFWVKGVFSLRELKKIKKMENDKNAMW